MRTAQRLRPVPRTRVAATAALIAAAIAGMIWMVEHLRHPLPSDGPAVPELDVAAADPRTEVTCPDPPPREGLERGEPSPADLEQIITVTSNELYDCPQTYSGRWVRYRGEAVGAVLRRTAGAWVQLNDDVYAETLGPLPAHRDFRGGNAGVGVLLPHALADQISLIGGPSARGDVLEVVGIFHRVDPLADEVSVIRASSGEIAVPGQPFDDPLLTDRLVAALILAPLALVLVLVERGVARRRSRGGARNLG